MRYKDSLLVLALLALVHTSFGQVELQVSGIQIQAKSSVDVYVFAHGASHVEEVSIVPVPSADPIWQKKTRSGRCSIPQEIIQRGVLIMASGDGKLAFSVIDEEMRKKPSTKNLKLRGYRRIRIITLDQDKRGASMIPVFMAATADLAMRHLS
ncbi:MAG: hypothetical protein ACI97A_002724 [Planctomycetota bacterium]|jgi:hypothetical protein